LGKPKQIIEINGKKYDAQTGHLIGAPTAQPQAKPAKTPAPGVALDGFVRSHATRKAHKPLHKGQKSKTLMRPAVRKPAIETQEAKPKVKKPGDYRLSRAKNTPKSHKISRFNSQSHAASKVTKKASALPVATPKHHLPNPQNIISPTVEHFEKAMHEASSHLETYSPAKNPKTRRAAIASLACVGLLALGVLAYQIMPLAKVKYAGTRAGFSASLPQYNPAGFGLNGDIAAGPGEVTLTYSSRTDDKNYKIKQSPSNWNSQSLEANFVAPNYGVNNYLEYPLQGKNIYISNDNTKATWVDGGVWYQIEGTASLTNDQLQRIVNSL
jgi:hypothetical protein